MKKEYLLTGGAAFVIVIIIGGLVFNYLNNKKSALDLSASDSQATTSQRLAVSTPYTEGSIPKESGTPLTSSSTGFVSYLYTTIEGKISYARKEIVGADPATFIILPEFGVDFAKDKNRVYYQGVSIDKADPATFTLVSPTFFLAKDKSYIYFIEHKLLGWKTTPKGDKYTDIKKTIKVVEGADPATFKIEKKTSDTLSSPVVITTFASDKNNNYIIKEERETCYGKPASCIGNITITTNKK